MVYFQEPIEKLLPYLKKSGINSLEIKPKEGHFCPQDIKDLQRLKKKFVRAEITVEAIHMPLNGVDISHSQQYERVKSVREVEKTILMAYHLGVGLVVVHPGGKVSDFTDRENRLKLSMESLKEIGEFAQSWDIKIALENTLPDRIGDKWEEISTIIETLSYPSLGICFDSGHHLLNYPETAQGKLGVEKIPINWQKYLWHIHIHDNDGKHDFHWLPGDGKFPWVSFMSFLKEIDYRKTLIFELKKQNELPYYFNKVASVWQKLNSYI